jgi:hypothetical protein
MVICSPNIDPNPIESMNFSFLFNCILVTNTIDGLDDCIESIIEAAESRNCLCIFGLNKKKLGNAVGKELKISSVGIYNYEGADYNGMIINT